MKTIFESAEAFISEDSSQAVVYSNPILMDITLDKNINIFMYKDYSGNIVKQYVSNNRVRVYFTNLNDAVIALNKNMSVVKAYSITCTRFVFGVNFMPIINDN